MPRCDASASVTAGLKCAPDDRAEGEYQRYQRRAGGYSIGEECNSDISTCQPLPHNAGADDRREEHGGSQGFGNDTARDRHLGTAARRTAGRRFGCADKGADEFAVNLFRQSISIEALPR